MPECDNRASEELWKYDKDEIIGKSVSMLFSDQQKNDDEFIRSYVSPGAQKTIEQRKEVNITGKEGNERPVLFLLSEATVDYEHTYIQPLYRISKWNYSSVCP